MLIKKGVYGFVHVALIPVICEYEVWRRTHGYEEGVQTAAMDGKHSPRSWHYEGRAADLRTFDMLDKDIDAMLAHLKGKFPDDYDIVREPTHLHVEYEGRWTV